MYIIYYSDASLVRSTIAIHANCDIAINMAKTFRGYRNSDTYICVDKISGDFNKIADENIFFEQCNGKF